jgi:ribosomal protein S6
MNMTDLKFTKVAGGTTNENWGNKTLDYEIGTDGSGLYLNIKPLGTSETDASGQMKFRKSAN